MAVNGALSGTTGAISEDNSGISQGAQDIASATGAAYSDVATSAVDQGTPDYKEYDSALVGSNIENLGGFKPTESYIDKATSTVAGQLQGLLASDSPYIKQVELKAKEEAQAAGLRSSSLAMGAGRREAYKAALPIATADAATYAKGNLMTQQAEQNLTTIQGEGIVSSEMVKQEAAIKQQNQNINNAFNARLQGADQESQVWLNDFKQSHDRALQDMNVEAQQMLSEMEIDANTSQRVREAAASTMQNYQISVENMLTDPDFLNLGPEAVNNALNQLQAVAQNTIGLVGASAGVDMDAILDEYLSPVELDF